jgi:hypothetical protein
MSGDRTKKMTKRIMGLVILGGVAHMTTFMFEKSTIVPEGIFWTLLIGPAVLFTVLGLMMAKWDVYNTWYFKGETTRTWKGSFVDYILYTLYPVLIWAFWGGIPIMLMLGANSLGSEDTKNEIVEVTDGEVITETKNGSSSTHAIYKFIYKGQEQEIRFDNPKYRTHYPPYMIIGIRKGLFGWPVITHRNKSDKSKDEEFLRMLRE